MKSTLLFLAASLFLVPLAEARPDRVREGRQEARINQGIKSGELTKHEANRLNRGQHRIDAAQAKAMADGQMSAEEKSKITKMQNHQSRQIYKQKHDGQDRNGASDTNQPQDNATPNQ